MTRLLHSVADPGISGGGGGGSRVDFRMIDFVCFWRRAIFRDDFKVQIK